MTKSEEWRGGARVYSGIYKNIHTYIVRSKVCVIIMHTLLLTMYDIIIIITYYFQSIIKAFTVMTRGSFSAAEPKTTDYRTDVRRH